MLETFCLKKKRYIKNHVKLIEINRIISDTDLINNLAKIKIGKLKMLKNRIMFENKYLTNQLDESV